MSGMARAWIGVGSVYPIAATPSRIFGDKPNVLNILYNHRDQLFTQDLALTQSTQSIPCRREWMQRLPSRAESRQRGCPDRRHGDSPTFVGSGAVVSAAGAVAAADCAAGATFFGSGLGGRGAGFFAVSKIPLANSITCP